MKAGLSIAILALLNNVSATKLLTYQNKKDNDLMPFEIDHFAIHA